MTPVDATSADRAEQTVGGNHPGLTITGSIEGDHKAADSEVYIQEFG